MVKRILHSVDAPPPIGGVTSSVRNIVQSLTMYDSHQGIYKSKDRLWFTYDYGHVHASNPLKRLLTILYFMIKCRKVLFTVHGAHLSDNIINRFSIRLADGVIFLNSQVFNIWQERVKNKSIIQPSIYKEGVGIGRTNNTSELTSHKLKLLVYANSRFFLKGEEVYGVEFVLQCLKDYPSAELTIIDISGEYKETVALMARETDIKYIDRAVNFLDALAKIDIYLRPTSTDGDSVAVREALLCGVKVLASDVVDRPTGVNTYRYGNKKDFIRNLTLTKDSKLQEASNISIESYINFLDNL